MANNDWNYSSVITMHHALYYLFVLCENMRHSLLFVRIVIMRYSEAFAITHYYSRFIIIINH